MLVPYKLVIGSRQRPDWTQFLVQIISQVYRKYFYSSKVRIANIY